MANFDDELNAALSGDEPVSDNDEWDEIQYCSICDREMNLMYVANEAIFCDECENVFCGQCSEQLDVTETQNGDYHFACPACSARDRGSMWSR